MDRARVRPDVFARLRDFAERTPAPSAPSAEGLPGLTIGHTASGPHGTCELCRLPLTEVHRHLYEMATREIVCACDGCALTFEGVADGRYKPIPRDARAVDPDEVKAIPWDQLSLPINLAFFVRDGDGTMTAYYPSPGGVTKSELPFDVFDELSDDLDILKDLEPHVEALLMNRLTQHEEVFIVPIDLCYRLTGLIRTNWRGFSGGEDVRREMIDFFEQIRSRVRPIRA